MIIRLKICWGFDDLRIITLVNVLIITYYNFIIASVYSRNFIKI